jgi:DNA-binding transcriptional LysR family regulator
LTEAGQIYYERSTAILADLLAADESVAKLRAEPRGVLKIGAPVNFGSAYIAPVLPQYLKANPEVRVDLTLNNRVVDLLEEGYDLVIRTGALPDSGLIARAIAPYQLIACASPEYIEAHGMPEYPSDLASHSCLGFRPGTTRETWTFTGQGGSSEKTKVPVKGPLAANDGQTLRQAALGGVGIILQAEALLRQDLAQGRLIRVLEHYQSPALPAHLLYSPTKAIAPKLRSFLDFAVHHFGIRALKT